MATRKQKPKKGAKLRSVPGGKPDAGQMKKTAQQVLDGMGEASQGTFAGTKTKSYAAAMKCVESKDGLEAARRKFNRDREKLGQVMTLEGTKVVQCGECTFTREGKEVIKLTGYKQKTDE